MDWVHVDVSAQSSCLSVVLYDGAGRVVWQQSTAWNTQVLNIPVMQLAQGQYVIRVSDGTLVRHEKILVN